MKYICLVFVVSLSTAMPAVAQVVPQGPPNTSGSGDAGMKHAAVTFSDSAVGVSIAATPSSPVVMTDDGFGKDFTAPKFDVLEDVYYNAQHGWNPDAFLSLPAEHSLWIKRTGATQPAGSTFKVYEGGNMIAETMGDWSMTEIYAADGDIWQWDAVMQHDYFTADIPGAYSMSFEVYVGDSSGVADTAYTPATATFAFSVVPEPSTLVLALLASFGLVRRCK